MGVSSQGASLAGEEGAGEKNAAPAAAGRRCLACPHWRALLSSLPLSFLGLGVYRAWIEIAFVGSFVDYPTQRIAGQDAFDLAMVVTLFLLSALHRRLTPLRDRRWARPLSAVLLAASTAGGFASVWDLGLAPVLAWPCAVAGGVSIAMVILLWSELYACESPVRVALLYSLSLVVGAVTVYVYRGFRPEWLPVMTCALPLASLLCLSYAYRGLPAHKRPAARPAAFTFPWKPIAVVGIYSFAFGLQETQSYAIFGPHSSPGMVACALVVIVAVLALGRRVEFQTVYGTWLPFLSAAFLLLPCLSAAGVVPSGGEVSAGGAWPSLAAQLPGLSVNLGYAASEIFVMTMVGSICYHYGASAVWLFGIERGVRAMSMLAGRTLESFLAASGLPLAPLVVVAVLAATFLVASDKRLDSTWGVRIQDPGAGEEDGADGSTQADEQRRREVLRRNALVNRCSELARIHRLTQREEEVLILLAEHKTAGDIERELLVANGTAKAHIGHVYQKLGIHSREELFQVTGATGSDARQEG